MKASDEPSSLPEPSSLDETEGDRALLSGAIDALVTLVPSDQRPLQGLAGLLDWRLRGLISRFIRQGVVTGRAGECVLLPWAPHGTTHRLILVGIGESKRALPEEALRALSLNLKSLKPRNAGVSCSDFESRAGVDVRSIAARLEGIPLCLVK